MFAFDAARANATGLSRWKAIFLFVISCRDWKILILPLELLVFMGRYMPAVSSEIKSAMKMLGIDISSLSSSEFDSLLREAEKLAPTIVRFLGEPDAAEKIGAYLLQSNGLKDAANRLGTDDKSTRLAHLAPKANVQQA